MLATRTPINAPISPVRSLAALPNTVLTMLKPMISFGALPSIVLSMSKPVLSIAATGALSVIVTMPKQVDRLGTLSCTVLTDVEADALDDTALYLRDGPPAFGRYGYALDPRGGPRRRPRRQRAGHA